MKTASLLLLPSVALLFSACASGPGGPVYGGPGYYGHDTVYVQGQDHRDYNDTQYNRSVTDVNDVNVNRTNVNERTVDRTNVNQTNVQKNNHPTRKNRKPLPKEQNNQQGNQQGPPHQ